MLLKCKKCELHKDVNKQCEPKGTNKPDIYLVGEAPGKNEDEEGIPFVGRSGKYLMSACKSFDITEENARWFNVVRCIPKNKSGSRTSVRKPKKEEVDKCHLHLISDILKTEPKVIIPLGTSATEYFFDYYLDDYDFTRISDIRGNIHKAEIGDKKFVLLPTYHPAYLIRNPNNKVLNEEFFGDLKKAKKIAIGEEEAADRDLLTARTYKEFKEFYVEELMESDMISFDIESNYKFPLSENAKVVGFSVASNVKKGIYVVFESLEYKMPREDRKKIEKILKDILLNKKIIVHNLLMEVPFILNWLGIEINNVEDTMMQSRLLLGGQSGASLKNQAVKLGFDNWSRDLDDYKSLLQDLYTRLKLTASGNARDEYDFLRENKSIIGLKGYVISQDEESFNNRQESLKDSLVGMVDLLNKYYEGEDLQRISNILAESLIERIVMDLGKKGKPESYGWIPERIISKYGALDAIAPIELYRHNLKKMDEMSEELGIDLHRGYKYWLQHAKAGYKLELNGAKWDEGIVNQEMENILPDGFEAHKNLIKSPLIKYDEIFEGIGCSSCKGLKEEFSSYLYEYYIGDILSLLTKHNNIHSAQINDNGDIEIELINKPDNEDDKSEELSLFPNSNIKVLKSGTADLFDYIEFDEFKDAYDMFLDKLIEDTKQEDKLDIEKLKFILNPVSTADEFRELLDKCLITGEVKLAKLYKKMETYVSYSDFHKEKFSDNDKLFIKKFIAIKDNNKFTDREKLEKFAKIIEKIHPNGYKLTKIIKESFNYKLDSVSEDDILDVYECYLLAGIDPEDKETWNENFNWLYNYRIYKKIAKMFSTYVKGNVGRNSVWVGDKEKFVKGKKFVPRKKTFYENRTDNNGKDEIRDNEVFIYQPDFGICTTISGRWRSGFHTLPWQSPPQRFFTSRFKGGTIAMPDFCLTGETNIKLLGGASKTIKELAEIYGKEGSFGVYSYDRTLKRIVFGEATNVRKTKSVDKIYKIKLDNGETIKCTGNHPFLLQNNKYKRADNLNTGEELMSLSDNMFGRFTENYNHKIVDIEVVEVDNIDVYDLEVDKYHNFAIDFPGDKSGVFVHNSQMEVRALAASAGEERMLEDYRNGLDAHISTATGMFDKKPEDVTTEERRFAKGGTFSIVYGSSVQSFAESYLDGDVEEAQRIFDDFFAAYSKIKEWIDKKHKEFEESGRVTLFTDRFINIPEGKGYYAKERAIRQSQNLPIQGGSSDLVGSVLYKVIEFIEERNYKSKPFAFVHDSIEIDIHPEEFLELSDKIVEYMNVYPDKEFGIPAKADLAIGYSLGEEIEVPKFYISDDYQEGIFLMKGYENEIDKLINSWKKHNVFRILEVDTINKEEKYIPVASFFKKKRAYTKYLGKTRWKCKKRVKMRY